MNVPSVARSAWRRLRHPAAWGAVIGFQAVWLAARLLSGVTWERMGSWEAFVPALFLVGHIALAPIPWQWTGNAQPRPGAWRGLVQAAAWNTVWVILLVESLSGIVRPAKPAAQRNRPPRMEQQAPRPSGEEARRPPRNDQDPPPPREGENDPRPRQEDPRSDRDPRPSGGDPPPPPGRSQEIKLLFLNLPFALVIGWFLADKERAESTEDELKRKAREAQTLALQAQLHPHALYNVLAGLTELVHEDPDAAEDALVGLVDLLRMLTRHATALTLPLGQERALVKRYLAIEQIRLGDRLKVQWEWPDWADALELPPLLLQPLVENAVKHGISPCPEGGSLRIHVSHAPQGLLIQVANHGIPLQAGAALGTGLANLQERLALMPERRASFHLLSQEGWTLAEVRMDTTLKA